MHQTSFGAFHEAQSHNLSICTVPCVASKEKAEDNGRDQSESAPMWEPSVGTRRIHSLCFITRNCRSYAMQYAETSERKYPRGTHRYPHSAWFVEHLQKQSNLFAFLLDLKTAHKRSRILTWPGKSPGQLLPIADAGSPSVLRRPLWLF